MKIANDLRWMNSGPLAGLGEIELPALQPGSSIMPGKVNPVIPEAAAMVAAQVIGNDTTMTLAGQSGNFQLNVMLPVIAYNLLQSIELLANVARVLADNAIAGLSVREGNIDRALARNPILVTALNPIIGYQKAAEIAKKAYNEGRAVIDVAAELTGLEPRGSRTIAGPAPTDARRHPEVARSGVVGAGDFAGFDGRHQVDLNFAVSAVRYVGCVEQVFRKRSAHAGARVRESARRDRPDCLCRSRASASRSGSCLPRCAAIRRV